MKPEILTIKNIGPFAGMHKIDFTKLGSIFLVCGKTGAGKTTIFDALSYIFYSKPSGLRGSAVRSLRSHFALDEENSETELIFSIGAERYRILRRLPFLKPGNKNERPEEVEFAKFENNMWQDKTSTNKSETDKKIRSLIKLNEKEFSRIVLLPQGEFAEFLKENSNQKKDTLAELFPISRYSEIMQLAKDKEHILKEHLKIVENSLSEIRMKFNPQVYKSQRQRIEEELNFIKNNFEYFNSERDKKNAELQQSVLLAEKIKEYEITVKELEAINAKDGMTASVQKKIDLAIKASPLSEKANRLIAAEKDFTSCQKEMEKIQSDLTYISERITELQSIYPEIQKSKIKTAELKKTQEDLKRVKLVFIEIEENLQKQKEYSVEIKSISEKLKNIYENEKKLSAQKDNIQIDIKLFNERMIQHSKLTAKLSYEKRVKEIAEKTEQVKISLKTYSAAAEKKKKELEDCKTDFLIEQKELEELQIEKKEIDQNKTAAVLAAGLIDGLPCPVCGSLLHPCAAVQDDRNVFTVEEKIGKCMRNIEKLQKEKELLNIEYSSFYTDAENYLKQLAGLENNFTALNKEYEENIFSEIPSSEEVKNIIALTSKELEGAAALLKKSQNANSSKIIIEDKLSRIANEKTEFEKEISELKILESGIKSSVKEKQKLYRAVFEKLDEDMKKNDIDDTIEKCSEQILLLDRKINGYDESKAELQTKNASLKAVFEEKENLIKKLNISILEQKAVLANEMEKYNFDNFDSLNNALLPEDEIKKLENDIKKIIETKTILKQKSDGLKKDIGEKPPADLEMLKDEIFILEKKIDEETKRRTGCIVELTQLDDLNSQYKKLEKEREVCAKNAAVIKSLSGDLNGINSRRLKFDIWILSAFLKEITVYANKRLKKMSGGRYILKVGCAAAGNNLAGLDLEVFDAYTGTSRTTASLSGGETFMTSISLALGLADSIQNRSGGIKLESMFIDEGFGSLDEVSLENAITILDEIRGNRMVGIISHVSELRTRIPDKIEIEKTNRGSRIKHN